MACPVQQLSPARGDLAARYGNPPDGIRVNMILSLDGAAAFDGLAGPLSDPTDQSLLLALRGYADIVLVGAGTARAERYGPVRLSPEQIAERRERWGIHDIPQIAVVTRTGDLPASLFAEGSRPMAVTTAEVTRTHPDLPQRADLLIAGEHEVDLAAAVERLRARGFHRVLCEGGPMLLDELIDADLVDEMCLTVSPTLAAPKSAGRPGAPRLRTPTRLRLGHALTVGDYAYLRYTR